MAYGYIVNLFTLISRRRIFMIYFKGDYGEVYRFMKVNPSDFTPETLIGSFPQYVTRERALALAKLFLTILRYEESVFLIEKTKGKVYQFTSYYDIPTFKESEIFSDIVNAFRRETNYSYENALNCALMVLLACEDVTSAKKSATKYVEKLREEEEKKPQWIPLGYHHVTGNMKTGYVVADSSGNEFTYIPYIDIYISRYEISRNSSGDPRSIPGMKAWVNLKYNEALEAAENFDPRNKSSLLRSLKAVQGAIEMATGISGIRRCLGYDGRIEIKTGSMSNCMYYNVDCLTGNHYCMLKTEKILNKGKKIGGSSYAYDPDEYSVKPKAPSREIGFRICLTR